MIEVKQLQYLVVCADLQSFSRASEVLYTSQPNVSKVIKSLEEELGFPLFERNNRGIWLTKRGKQVYDYASKVIENVEQLSLFAGMDQKEEFRLSFNPSSWMSLCFADFYNQYQEESVFFHVMSASVEEIIQRCSSGRDDIGFVFITKKQMLPFQYKLERKNLEFIELKQTKAMLYFGRENPMGQKTSLDELPIEKIRLVQCYEDEFVLKQHWDMFCQKEEEQQDIKVSVVTNSDYIMSELLKRTNLGNISSGYLSEETETHRYLGVPLYEEEPMVLFGCIHRKEENLGKWAEIFLEFVKNRLCYKDLE